MPDRLVQLVQERLNEVDLSRADVGVTQQVLRDIRVGLPRNVLRVRVSHHMRGDVPSYSGSLRDFHHELPKRLR